MTWAQEAIDDLTVGDPAGFHLYIGIVGGTSGVFLYNGATLLGKLTATTSASNLAQLLLGAALTLASDTQGDGILQLSSGISVQSDKGSSSLVLLAPTVKTGNDLVVNGDLSCVTDKAWIDSTTNGEIITATTGVANFIRAVITKSNKTVSFTYSFTLAAAITVSAATGNITDTTVGVLKAPYITSAPYVQIISGGTPEVIGYVNGSLIQLAATSVNATLPAGTTLLVGGTYQI